MAKDFIYDSEFDIAVDNGDFVVDISDEQHAEDIMVAHKGHYKQFPLTGIGVIDYLHSPMSLNDRDSLKRQIMLQLEADGMKNIKVDINGESTITIKGNYP